MNISRRTLLRGFGTAIALPWMESMVAAANAGRATNQPPIRMAFMYVPNGVRMSHWTPFGKEETGFQTPKIFEPVANYLDQTTIISGLSLRGANALGDGGGDHARSVAAFLTGAHPRKNSWFKNSKRKIDRPGCGGKYWKPHTVSIPGIGNRK